MRIIKMNADKSLVTTVRSTIYQYENNADTLVFLVPTAYEDVDIALCNVLLWYETPDKVEHFEGLEMDTEIYKGHYRYHLKVTTALTTMFGKIKVWLNIVNPDDDFVLKSGTTFIDIIPNNENPDSGAGNNSGIIEFDKDVSVDGDDTDTDNPNEISGDIIHF